MDSDPFASPMISQILTWTFSIPLICGILIYPASVLFKKQENVVFRIFFSWMLLCLLLLSPIRYILLQLLGAIAFPCQSFDGFLATFLLAIYIPIVFGILYAIGLGIPFLLIYLIVGKNDPPSKLRLFLSGIAAPVIFFICSTIYYYILPYAAYSTHWLGPNEVIRTTNGPPYYFYRFVVEPFTPLQFSGIVKDIGYENMTAKERFRAHVVSVYCGDKQHAYYVFKSYPDYFEKRKREMERDQ